MQRPRLRIGTLMLLVVIAALVVALIVERGKSRTLLADAQAAQAQAIEREIQAQRAAQTFNAELQAAPRAAAR